MISERAIDSNNLLHHSCFKIGTLDAANFKNKELQNQSNPKNQNNHSTDYLTQAPSKKIGNILTVADVLQNVPTPNPCSPPLSFYLYSF